MDHDDLLDDLLSWSPSQSSCRETASTTRGAPTPASPPTLPTTANTPSPTPRQRPRGLHETCVNTAVTATRAHVSTADDGADTPGVVCHADAREDERVRGRTATTTAVPRLRLPAAVHARLFPHQRDGVQWLYYRHCTSRACLLADEMGLGKTVQVAAFLGQLYARALITTTIIVVPPTLLPVWTSALATWGDAAWGAEEKDTAAASTCAATASASPLSRLVEVIHNEPRGKRQARWRKLRYGVPCLLLTTYGVLRQDAADMSATLVDYVVLDEAHLIKDARTCVFKSALTLAARHKIALTGTPLMNTFEDMWSIFRFLDGSILDMNKDRFKTVSATLLRGNERDASAAQRAAASGELATLQAAIRPFMLRREKKDVAAGVLSSEKCDLVVWVRLSAVQQALYAAFLESTEVSTARAATASSKRGCSSSSSSNNSGGGLEEDEEVLDAVADWAATEDDPANHNRVTSPSASSSSSLSNPLLLLTMLGQICSHPWLSLTDEAFAAALRDRVSPYTAPLAEMGDVFAGAKLWVALRLLLRCIGERRKTLVFSRSRRLLRLLGFLLRDWGVRYTQVDGEMPSDRRCAAVDRFNDGDGDGDADTRGAREVVWVCLLTTQVGGVGLTFSAASAVVLLDPSWNPSADAQAVDRVHRIGQRRDVMVYRLVTCGTVEEKVYRNQIFKRMAALQSTTTTAMAAGAGAAVEDGPSASPCGELHRYFTRLQLRSMFVMDDVNGSTTAAQLARLHPGRVDPALREALCGIDGVCDVSDNACILTEAVHGDATVLDGPARVPPAASSRPTSGTASSGAAVEAEEEAWGDAAPTPQPVSSVREAAPHRAGVIEDDRTERDRTERVPQPCPVRGAGVHRRRARAPDRAGGRDDDDDVLVLPHRRFCGESVPSPRPGAVDPKDRGGTPPSTLPAADVRADRRVRLSPEGEARREEKTVAVSPVRVVQAERGHVDRLSTLSTVAGPLPEAAQAPPRAEKARTWRMEADGDEACGDVAMGGFEFVDGIEMAKDADVAEVSSVIDVSCGTASSPLVPCVGRVAAAATRVASDGDGNSSAFASCRSSF